MLLRVCHVVVVQIKENFVCSRSSTCWCVVDDEVHAFGLSSCFLAVSPVQRARAIKHKIECLKKRFRTCFRPHYTSKRTVYKGIIIDVDSSSAQNALHGNGDGGTVGENFKNNN
jgi:hypothetical protein